MWAERSSDVRHGTLEATRRMETSPPGRPPTPLAIGHTVERIDCRSDGRHSRFAERSRGSNILCLILLLHSLFCPSRLPAQAPIEMYRDGVALRLRRTLPPYRHIELQMALVPGCVSDSCQFSDMAISSSSSNRALVSDRRV